MELANTAMGNDRDLNRTRERIVAAASSEFSRKGFSGARTDAIARCAGVNERMIFYCFENKEGIDREVLRRKLSVAGRDGSVASVKDQRRTASRLRRAHAATGWNRAEGDPSSAATIDPADHCS